MRRSGVDRVEDDNLLALVSRFADQLLGVVEIALAGSASKPAVFAIGVPQVKKDGQRFQFLGSPAKAFMKSA
jgi:hypothetical protein